MIHLGPVTVCPSVWFDNQSFSSDALSRLAGKVLNGLLCTDLPPGARVGIVMQNSPHAMAVLVALWNSDLVAVPINPQMPAAAKVHALTTNAVSAVIVEDESPLAKEMPDSLRVLTPGTLAAKQGTPRSVTQRGDEDLAFVLHTSGSTGRPKGVEIAIRTKRRWAELFADAFF